ncbi:hypothetical protein L9F63_011350 [Diploptera punctata]|uniref:Carrier domain-containing protein n=1 Tax=Diploptera punctata TaxID=6984 RepID=A0AAD8AEV3_DIPPU|nr:hypothetical protein L9F63_011350 [Diploptera punctata]
MIPACRPASMHWVSSSVLIEDGTVPLVDTFGADYFMNIVTGTVYIHEALMHVPDNAIVIEVSPHCALQTTLQKVLPASVTSIPLMSKDESHHREFLLSGLGKLYNAGVQMNLSNLYPKVSFPVPRGTQMINSMVQWDHSEEWMVPNFWYKAKKDGSRPNKCSLSVDLTKENDMYLKGHIVNQNLLFPVAGYLQLVWKGFSEVNQNWFENVSVRFENVEFHEETVIPESVNKYWEQYDNLMKFELYENKRLVASGYICELQDESREIIQTATELDPPSLTTQDVYTDLRLRGYQYSGHFCSIKESDNKGTNGTVEWQNNWVTFLDSLFQFAQIGTTDSELFLPSRLSQLTINVQQHHLVTSNQEIKVQVEQKTNLMQAGGVQLQGVEFYMQQRNKEKQNDPQIEKQIFIPYINKGIVPLGRAEALTVMVQILHENVNAHKMNILELANTLTEEQLLSPHIVPIIKTQPDYKANVSIQSSDLGGSTMLQSLNIKTVDNPDEDDEYHLLITHSNNIIYEAGSLLCPGGFVLFEKQLDGPTINIPGFILVSVQQTTTAEYILLRKEVDEAEYTVVKVTSDNFQWIKRLQSLLRNSKYLSDSRIVVLSQKQHCGALGLYNTLVMEPNVHRLRCVVVQDAEAPEFCADDDLYKQQLHADLCVNVYRAGMWGSLRQISIVQQDQTTLPVQSANLQVINPSTVAWVQAPSKPIKRDNNEVLCNVHYASVSLNDVVHSSGETKNNNIQNSHLGQEFSGYDSSGERVMGLVSGGALATQVMTSPSFLWHVPANWSLQEAATVPHAYALKSVVRGRIRGGEWVLIHCADSAVTFAAAAVCLHRGCRVITTKQINQPNIHVVSITNMHTDVLSLTGGRGVDILLTSKHTPSLVQCVTQHGCILDIGPTQLNTNLGISVLGNKTYHRIQMDYKSADTEQISTLMSESLESGVVTPMAAQVFSHNEIQSAFQYVKNGDSSKKVIVWIQGEKENKLSAIPKLHMDPEKVYILIGGLGGFGMELAQWMVQRGARKLVLTSRRGIVVGYKALRIRRWQEAGVTVITSTQDVATEEGAKCLLDTSSKLGPIAGIFILSMVLRDALFENHTEENFQQVCRAKVDVARSLDLVSRRDCPDLEYFVAFSSIASSRGNIGQTAYGMANSILEIVCEERRSLGLHGLAIQWGPVGDVGVVYDTIGNNVVMIGTVPQNIESCLRTLEQALRQSHAVVASHVLHDTDITSVEEKDILSTVANVLGIKDISSVNPNADAEDLGIDSLMSAEIKSTLQDEFSVNLSSQEIYKLMVSTLREQAA